MSAPETSSSARFAGTFGRPAGVTSGRTRSRQSPTSVSRASGACTRKIDSQPSVSVRIPPIAGPSAAPATPADAQVRTARASEPSVSVSRSSAAQTRQRAAERLHAACADQHAEGRREPAGERRCREHERPDRERRHGPPPRGIRGRDGRRGEHEVVRREHPRHLRDLDVEVAQDVRQRERDDRGVGEREPDPEADQRPSPRRSHGATLGRGAGPIRRTLARAPRYHRGVPFWAWIPLFVLLVLAVLLGVVVLLGRIRGGRYLRPVITFLSKVPLFKRWFQRMSIAALERQNPELASAMKKMQAFGEPKSPSRPSGC